MDMSFLKMLEHGGIVIIVLLVCSVISVAVIIERLKVFYGIRPKVMEQVKLVRFHNKSRHTYKLQVVNI